MRKFNDLLVFGLVRIFVATVQTMSVARCQSLCDGLSFVFGALVPVRRRTVDRNLKLVFPDASDQQIVMLRCLMWRHLLLMVCEIAWAPRRLHRTNWRDHFRIVNKKALVRRMLDQRPAVLVTGHYGNFELAGYMTGLLGIPTMTIARPLDNPYLHQFVTRFRGAGGQQMVPKEGSAPLVQQHLKSGGLLSLLADQHAGPKGCWADFLGHPASCHKALALFTLTGDAPMCVMGNRRLDRPMQFELRCFGIADPRSNTDEVSSVTRLTNWYNARLADAVRLAPEQYWWVHRRWRGEPPRRRASKLSAAA